MCSGGSIVFREFAVPDIGQVLLAAMNGSESMQVRGWRNAGLISLHDKIFDKQCDRAIVNVQAGDLVGDTGTGGEEDVLPGWVPGAPVWAGFDVGSEVARVSIRDGEQEDVATATSRIAPFTGDISQMGVVG